MKTILVPTDFSATAKNAARYAIELAKQTKAEKIILYNVFQTGFNVIADPMIPALGALDLEAIKEGSIEALANFKKELSDLAGDKISLETVSEFALLTDGIIELSKAEKVDLIVMGITGGGALQENLFGSNTINVAKNTTVPVLIVPQKATFTKFEKILLACDFRKVVESTPVGPIKKLLDQTKAKLFVLHIDNSKKENATDVKFESLMLDTLLEGYQPEYHFADDPDFTEGINEFVVEKDIDLVITIPKKHDLFDSIFKRSHTKMLAFHSHVPLMVIHD
jgi:nucleotide-binding universal stress UspA family protein